ncbi:MAG: D-glycero-beta-D-manno-heptose-7-phosphate kinase [Hydrotalea sp.]|nr:D-glycero-beta-D-manno-heptose-7-phosphate kinase [Hydrotalea sp.]
MTAASFLDKLQSALTPARVLVVGDAMLDSYVYGRVDRISQEAPIPVLSQIGDPEYRPGGAANVARNIVTLGAGVSLVSMVGDDAAGKILQQLLAGKKGDERLQKFQGFWLTDKTRVTTEKTRYTANKQQMLRLDREDTKPIDDAHSAQLLPMIENSMATARAVVISDYGKGLLTRDLLQKTIALAKQKKLPVVVDPKGNDFTKYRGADYITPNRLELQLASNMPTTTTAEVIAAGQQLIAEVGFKGVVATRSEEGLSLIEKNVATHFKTDAQEVFDVAGAGDTVVAVFAAALAAGLPPVFASRLANAGGGVVVGKSGAADATLQEIIAMLLSSISHGKHLLDEATMLQKVAAAHQAGKKIVVANGCFDLLHDGHVAMLQAAKQQGDFLLVLINSDASVQRLKGDSLNAIARPFQPAVVRADGLLGLAEVDAVAAFDDDTPARVIEKIKPDVLVKGEDYKGKPVAGAEHAGRLYLAPLTPGFSTSNVIKNLSRR